ncbi:MAG: tRNA (guanosine(37)-N1)-methyltransferase TrmD [Deltaproteobacteria bacterium]
MQIDLLTLFPEFFTSPLSQSMSKRAQSQGAVSYRVINLRDYTTDKHQVTDDRPFGGGPGMVMKIEPLVAAIRAVRQPADNSGATPLMLAAAGGHGSVSPGVLGGEGATEEESFQEGLLEYPHYTRPRVFEGREVPRVLLEGDHQRIARWRRQQALARTVTRRPDLLAQAVLSKADREFIKSLASGQAEDR